MQKLTVGNINTTCEIAGAILIEQNEKVQHSSSVTLNSVILKYCSVQS